MRLLGELGNVLSFKVGDSIAKITPSFAPSDARCEDTVFVPRKSRAIDGAKRGPCYIKPRVQELSTRMITSGAANTRMSSGISLGEIDLGEWLMPGEPVRWETRVEQEIPWPRLARRASRCS